MLINSTTFTCRPALSAYQYLDGRTRHPSWNSAINYVNTNLFILKCNICEMLITSHVSCYYAGQILSVQIQHIHMPIHFKCAFFLVARGFSSFVAVLPWGRQYNNSPLGAISSTLSAPNRLMYYSNTIRQRPPPPHKYNIILYFRLGLDWTVNSIWFAGK